MRNRPHPNPLEGEGEKLDLVIRASVGKTFVPFLRRCLGRGSRLLPGALRDVSVILVDDRVMSDLHLRFMSLPGTTDVLTFPMDETSGEVIICVPEARRRAKQHGTKLKHELLLYAIHGMLHLCGMDDRTRAGFERMHRMEDEILTRIGVGPVFHASTEKNRRAGFSLHGPSKGTKSRDKRR